jgi:iron complex transport system ATP-binding protein
MIMDEPTSHLDLGNKKRIADIILELNRRGISLILTTHDPDFAVLTADQAVLLCDGRVLDTGLCSEVVSNRNLRHMYGEGIELKEVDGRPVVTWLR